MSEQPPELSLATCTVETFRPQLDTRFALATPADSPATPRHSPVTPADSPATPRHPPVTPADSPATPAGSPATSSPSDSPATPPGERVALRLVQAVGSPPSPTPSASAPREPFSLLFAGPPQPLLPQGTYALQHEALGLMELFLVPVARDADGISYEAVFA